MWTNAQTHSNALFYNESVGKCVPLSVVYEIRHYSDVESPIDGDISGRAQPI